MAYLPALTDQQNMCLSELSNLAGYLKGFEGWSLNDIPNDSNGILQRCKDAGLGDIKIVKNLDENLSMSSELVDRILNLNPPDDIKEFILTAPTGLRAVAFKDNNDNMGFSFAGTDEMNFDNFWKFMNWLWDVADDLFSQFILMSPQVIAAENFLLDIINNYPHREIHLYGLSHGGLIAQVLLSKHKDEIDMIHIQNSQNASQIDVDNEKVDAVRTEDEFLHNGPGQYHADNELWVEGSGDSGHRHGYDGTEYDDGYAKSRNICVSTNKMREYVCEINEYIKLLDLSALLLQNCEKCSSLLNDIEIKPGTSIDKPQDKFDFSSAYARIRQAITICQHTQEYLNVIADKFDNAEENICRLFD